MFNKIFLRIAVPVASAIAVVILAVWGIRLTSRVQPGKPNILLITLDTTRADRLGAYGWRHARTPNIDRLAEEGLLFTRAYSAVPMTLPSHATIMTGLYPFYHGVRDNSGFRLAGQARTLAEMLSDHGYRTGAVLAAFVLDAGFGLDQGFDDYLDDVPARSQVERMQVPERNAQKVVDCAINWLKSIGSDKPYFLWCHFYDPHHPYLTPRSFPFYRSHPYDQEIAFVDFHLGRLLDYLEAAPVNDRATIVVLAGDHGEALGEYGEETHAYFAYDSTLHVPLVFKLPDNLRAGTRIDVPVGLVDIMPTILDLAGVPPPGDGEIHGRSLAGVLRGDAGAEESFASRPLYFESYAPAYAFGWAPVRGVRVGQAKYIDSPEPELYLFDTDRWEGAGHNVYERHTDRATELAAILHGVLESPLGTPPLSGTTESLAPEVVQNLRSLGYVAAPGAREPEWTPDDDLKKRLPLYRAILAASSQISSGNFAAGAAMLLDILRQDPDNPRALLLLAEAVVADPDQAEQGLAALEAAAHRSTIESSRRATLLANTGRAYLAREQPARALVAFQEAVDVEPRDPGHLAWLATAYLHLGQPAAALEPARRAVELAPGFDESAALLGLAEFCCGQSEAGARTWGALLTRADNPISVWRLVGWCTRDKVVAARSRGPLLEAASSEAFAGPVRAALQAACGRILLEAGQYQPALSAFRTAGALLGAGDVSSLWWRAKTLQALGRLQEAATLLQEAYQQDQTDIRVVVDLATVRHRLGDTGSAVELLSVYYQDHPENPTAANNLAWMLAERNQQDSDLDQALDLAKYAVQKRGSNSSFVDTLGWVHLKRNDAESAISAFSRAVQLEPTGAEFHFHLGLAYRKDGQYGRAGESFAAAVRLASDPPPAWLGEARSLAAGAP
jgi:arylsulfatase A-like enzyme/tetratricopeptide (TPR) repeat protein